MIKNLPAEKKKAVYTRMEVRRKCKCLTCGKILKKNYMVGHYQEKHPNMIKVSTYDLI